MGRARPRWGVRACESFLTLIGRGPMTSNEERHDDSNMQSGQKPTADRTADLIREVLRRHREGGVAPSTSAQRKNEPNSSEPARATELNSSNDLGDAVARVLRQYREGNAARPEPAAECYPLESDVSANETLVPEPTPQQVVEPLAPRPGASRKKKRRRSAREEQNDSDSPDLSSLSTVFIAPTAEVEPRSWTLDALDDKSNFNEPRFDSLAIEAKNDKNTSPTEFLEQLSQEENVSNESGETAAALQFLKEESALEKAANDAPMWLVSLCFHLLLILLLAFCVINTDFRKNFEVVSEPGFSDEIVLDEVFDPDAAMVVDDAVDVDANDVDVQTDVVEDVPDVSAFDDPTAAAMTVLDSETYAGAADVANVENLLGSLNGDDLSGRGANKAEMLVSGGGSEGSEKSVALALSWIAEHQLPNGSWSFKMTDCPTCRGQCRNSGSVDARLAATSMALLPFLAAGNTPTVGKYKKVVAAGMNYLTTHGESSPNGLSFREEGGNMYSHGLATITLCETYSMLSKRERKRFAELGYQAQDAIHFIEYAQADDGGWRYNPKQAGDTSVTGWQLMALKSGQLAGFPINTAVISDARGFLRDVVSFEDESRYYYRQGESESNATDSIGLLCRLYLDWNIENEKLLKGVKRLASIGPNLNIPYYTYYAAQLMYNVGGEIWSQWNARVRDALVKSQIMDGHERGSWYPQTPEGHCSTGGRLYVTSLNCMVLEVYYRHMPLYQKMEQNTNFPIDVPAE